MSKMYQKTERFRQLVIFVCFLVTFGRGQLIINVKNQGGDVVQETIYANASDDTITLEFQRSDGTLVTQLIDFRNEVQIIKTLILGEEERGQSQYQVMCFVVHFVKDSFISSDAMSKLRQKNPSSVRTPEDDLGRVNHTMDYNVVLKHSSIISPFINDLCAEAAQSTYTRYDDILKWSNIRNRPTKSFQATLKPFPTTSNIDSCTNTKNMWQPCWCHLEQCIGWYPCELKYCKGRGQQTSSYRCGIKTCKVCHLFLYFVAQKQQCLWDE
ncbi:unnamed protein product [Ceutorhynchus assimilis]|uniref:Out at first protein n=1 Tax=Ceutorhynchus assimilis TaxID=467358 RepID=A0A9P0DM45_9CUCU|nr:unnamed protein product [Ceutorhynchus assimilis]